MVRRMMVMAFCLVVAALLCGVTQPSVAEDSAKKDQKATEEKRNEGNAKEENKEEGFRDGVNRAFDGLKKETAKGKKNLNDLYDREKAKSVDEKAK